MITAFDKALILGYSINARIQRRFCLPVKTRLIGNACILANMVNRSVRRVFV